MNRKLIRIEALVEDDRTRDHLLNFVVPRLADCVAVLMTGKSYGFAVKTTNTDVVDIPDPTLGGRQMALDL